MLRSTALTKELEEVRLQAIRQMLKSAERSIQAHPDTRFGNVIYGNIPDEYKAKFKELGFDCEEVEDFRLGLITKISNKNEQV